MNQLLQILTLVFFMGLAYPLGRLTKCYLVRDKYDERWWQGWKQYYLNFAGLAAAALIIICIIRLILHI